MFEGITESHPGHSAFQGAAATLHPFFFTSPTALSLFSLMYFVL
jgi:hypothetical protein